MLRQLVETLGALPDAEPIFRSTSGSGRHQSRSSGVHGIGGVIRRLFAAAGVRDEVPDAILGAGSVIDAGTAAQYINSGANFIVGPVTNPDVAKVCNRRKIPYTPGCGTASEISYAEELGCEIIKVFPGSGAGGPGFIKDLMGPMPWSSLMPTGGVDITRESLEGWFNAGVVAVGMGSRLVSSDIVSGKDWATLEQRSGEVVALINKIRSGD